MKEKTSRYLRTDIWQTVVKNRLKKVAYSVTEAQQILRRRFHSNLPEGRSVLGSLWNSHPVEG